jgi:hypothetical protein
MSKKSIYNSCEHSECDRTTRGNSCVFQYELPLSNLAAATFLFKKVAPPRSNKGEKFYEKGNDNVYV